MDPVVNYQCGMTSNLFPWNQSAFSFDVNSSLMSIPNLMIDPSFGFAPVPTPAITLDISSSEIYQPSLTRSPPPYVPMTSPAVPPRISAPRPPVGSLPIQSPDGPTIRLDPLVVTEPEPFFTSYRSIQQVSPNKKINTYYVLTYEPSSLYNQAHFQNQGFEPSHWEPKKSRK